MDLSLLPALSGHLAALRDIGSALISIRDTAKLDAMRGDFLDQIVSARETLFAIQTERSELVSAIAALEAEKKELMNQLMAEKQKSQELDQYEIFQPTPGVWAYAMKGAPEPGKESPAYCPRCYQNRSLSILQRDVKAFTGHLNCPQCTLSIPDGTSETPSFG